MLQFRPVLPTMRVEELEKPFLHHHRFSPFFGILPSGTYYAIHQIEAGVRAHHTPRTSLPSSSEAQIQLVTMSEDVMQSIGQCEMAKSDIASESVPERLQHCHHRNRWPLIMHTAYLYSR